MVTIRVKENSKQAKALIQMLKTFEFVEFVEGLGKIATTKNQLMIDIEKGLIEIKLAKEGKLKLKPVKELFNEK